MADIVPLCIWQTYKIPIVLGSVSFLCIAISLTLLFKSYQITTPIEFSSDTQVASVAGGMAGITIDIEGAVMRPGVYYLPMGARVEDAIIAAGGLSEQSDDERIAHSVNRASRLSDGAKLYIPKKGEVSEMSVSGISINTSSQHDLETLAGVGPATSKKIIDGRPYQTLEELVSKKSLSQSLFEKIKDQLSL